MQTRDKVPEVRLKYDQDSIPLEYDAERFVVLSGREPPSPLSDIELDKKLDAPIGTPPLEDIVGSGEKVLFVVPDATRRTGAGQIINLLVRRLIASGTVPFDISIIFATGIHRPVTEAEKHEILTPFIARRIKTLDHSPRDLMRIARVGETAEGIPIELNRALLEADHIVIIGGVTFHYFAGFTGGRKLVCPGLASTRTVTATHRLAFDFERKTRREGAGTALLDGNPVHEAFMEAAGMVKPSFAVSSIVDDDGSVVDLFCGEWIGSHRAACDAYAADNTVTIAEKRDLVVASCGGSPYDINMIQAHKALEAASHACVDGGTIILLAACREGMGRTDFLDWFDAADSRELAERLSESYQVNGQTAWSLLRKTERFRVKIATEVDDADVRKLRMEKIEPASIVEDLSRHRNGYIVPFGARVMLRHHG